jgi:DNA-binding NtrC family response regulator
MTPARRVLIVDDEPLVRWALAERLGADGFDVLQTQNADEACEHITAGVDVVLLDHRLVDIDGLSILRRLRATHPRLPVILVTASADGDVTREATALGVHAILPKPFNLDSVARTIDEALLR